MRKRRRRSLLNRFLFLINTLFAIVLILAYILPYIPPRSFPLIAVLSLGMPVLIVGNLLFLAYWIIFGMKRELFLSLFVLLIGINHVFALYKFSSTDTIEKSDKEFKVMSYNVRQFNRYLWLKDEEIPSKIEAFIREENPDIVNFQEYVAKVINLSEYNYVYEELKVGNFGQAIYSKYPLINKTTLDFPKTGNNVIYADMIKEQDTIRIFNMHLQSMGIDPELRNLDKHKSKKLTYKIGKNFKIQQTQTEQLIAEMEASPYPVLLTGDMNNTAFSYIYHQLVDGYQDAFKEAGSGLGRSFTMDFIPLRIDFMFLSPNFKIHDFKTYNQKLSDHYPIMGSFELAN